MQKVKALSTGSTIGIIATGSPLANDRLQSGVKELEERGYQVKIPLDPSRDYGKYDNWFSNGSIKERVDAFHALVEDPEVAAIVTARGGYGTADLLSHINFDLLAKNPKLIVGMSDVTALLVQSSSRAELPSVHGAGVGTSFADCKSSEDAKVSVESLLSVISDPEFRFSTSCEVLRGGAGEGSLIAGNLSVLTTLLGTPWDIDYRSCVLVLEDVGEAPFHIHRALTQLKMAGKFEDLSALVFGRFSRCESKHGPSAEDVLRGSVDAILGGSKFPVLFGLEFGHWGENQALALGCLTSVKDESFQVLESPLID